MNEPTSARVLDRLTYVDGVGKRAPDVGGGGIGQAPSIARLGRIEARLDAELAARCTYLAPDGTPLDGPPPATAKPHQRLAPWASTATASRPVRRPSSLVCACGEVYPVGRKGPVCALCPVCRRRAWRVANRRVKHAGGES